MDQSKGPRRTFTEEIELASSDVVDRVKQLIAEGNVRSVRVSTPGSDQPFLEVPLTGGVVGGGVLLLVAPWLAALAALAAVVAKVKVEVVRDVPEGDTSTPAAGTAAE